MGRLQLSRIRVFFFFLPNFRLDLDPIINGLSSEPSSKAQEHGTSATHQIQYHRQAFPCRGHGLIESSLSYLLGIYCMAIISTIGLRYIANLQPSI